MGYNMWLLLATVTAALVGTTGGSHANPSFPSYGNDTNGPEYFITYGLNGSITTTLNAPDQGPYDGNDDTYIGVINNSGHSLSGIGYVSSTTNIFGFDGDGIDTYGAPGNSMDTSGYGGPDTYFANINAARTAGDILFVNALANGQSTYFSLEEALTLNQIGGIIPPVPEPASLALLGSSLALLYGLRRRRNRA